jgi:hypothetical protein
MKTLRKLSITLFATIGVLIPHLVSAPPAAAVGGPGLGCSTHANKMWKSGSTITVVGSQRCDAWLGIDPVKLTVSIKRSRWYGWETMSSTNTGYRTPSFYSEISTAYDCGGTGTHTFRGVADGWAWPGIGSVSEWYEARWSC